ncbi:putative zinc-binding metallopeptidase [Porphyromonas pogonae]|uniref:putative zinc-binding metallopeptidase n=1 Tax=Porphyromonas pogonae TaxID=867595 RepID=UPI002E79B4B6|nr:putative zinc-binding metallopeptidase [Porphyromonas pogonae]
MKIYLIPLLLCFLFGSISCNKADVFEKESVIRPTLRPHTELDKWIDINLTKKYNIDVQYRWDANLVVDIPNVYPPDEAKIKPVLETITELLFDIYSLKTIGGKDFVKKNSPKQILLFGSRTFYSDLGEEISHNLKPLQMQIFDLDSFDPADVKKVRKVMRMAHSNFVNTLTSKYPYDIEEFKKLNFTNRKLTWNEDGKAYFPLKFGYFSPDGTWKPEQDFAETASVLLSYSRKEIDEFIQIATTPIPIDPNDDPSLLDQRIEEKNNATKALKTLKAKQAFVAKYYKEVLGIDLYKLQAECAVAMYRFIKKNNKPN